MAYLDDLPPYWQRAAGVVLTLLYALEVLLGAAMLTLSACLVPNPGDASHITSCGRLHPWSAPVFLAVAIALYAGTRWLASRHRGAGDAILGLLVLLPPIAIFVQ
jgi:hypothetical protein